MTSSLLLMGVALAYVLLMLHIDRCRTQRHRPCDHEALNVLAFQRECSVFQLFIKAGADWMFSRAKIETDFDNYIREGEIPPYVRAYVRENSTSHRSYQDRLFTGNALPPSATP